MRRCPLLAQSGHSHKSHLMSLLGVKRTLAFAACRLLTQSGHQPGRAKPNSSVLVYAHKKPCPEASREANETARIHKSICWFSGSRLGVRGPRATTGDPAGRVS